VQQLLAAGANLEATDHLGTPLHTAASHGRYKVVQVLLQHGANPRAEVGGHTGLSAAAFCGGTRMVQLMLESWGEPAITAAALVRAAQRAACLTNWTAFATLAKELHQRFPAEVGQLFGFALLAVDHDAAAPLAAVLTARAFDISTAVEQQAAVRKREEAVALEQAAVQRLVVQVACMAKLPVAHEDPAPDTCGEGSDTMVEQGLVQQHMQSGGTDDQSAPI
jgi:hypothetical protein